MPTLVLDPTRLRLLRLSRGRSCKRLALAAGIHRQTLERLEGGKRNANVNTIARLTDALGVDPLEIAHIETGG